MLYHLLYEQFYPLVSPFRVFSYITVRTALAGMTALALGVMLGPWFIRKLREAQIGQHIREDGPQSHQTKAGTPTMGGLLINVSIVVPTLLWADLRNIYVWLAIFALIGFGAIGFLDDVAKIRRANNLGLTARRRQSGSATARTGLASPTASTFTATASPRSTAARPHAVASGVVTARR